MNVEAMRRTVGAPLGANKSDAGPSYAREMPRRRLFASIARSYI